jgi:hypothetical protein
MLTVAITGCGSGGGSAGDSARAQSSAPASIQISANPAVVASGESTWISWSAPNATACQASDGWSGDQPTSGSFRTPPVTATTTYALNCSGAKGGAMGRVTVRLQGDTGSGPSVTLKSVAGSVPLRGGTTLQWEAVNANRCVASGGWSGKKPAKGSAKVSNLQSDTTFTLSCDGPDGTAMAMTEVMVQTATLRWSGSGTPTPDGFRVYWGKSSAAPENAITITKSNVREQLVNLPGPGTYYFVLATLDAGKNETGRSNQVSKELPL